MLCYILSIVLTISSFTAQFVQDKQTAMLASAQHSEGKLTYHAPDYLRWEYLSPQALVWEVDGNEGNMNRQLRSMVIMIRKFISGDIGEMEKDFEVEQQGNTLRLVPKKRELKRLFTEVIIVLNPSTNIADKVEFFEPNSDHTTIVFSNVRFEQ